MKNKLETKRICQRQPQMGNGPGNVNATLGADAAIGPISKFSFLSFKLQCIDLSPPNYLNWFIVADALGIAHAAERDRRLSFCCADNYHFCRIATWSKTKSTEIRRSMHTHKLQTIPTY